MLFNFEKYHFLFFLYVVLTAQQTLFSAILSAIENRPSELLGVVSLYHALGGGIK